MKLAVQYGKMEQGYWDEGLKIDCDEFRFAVTENSDDVAMVFFKNRIIKCMTNPSNFHQFSYVIEANLDVKNELISWVIKSQEYVNQYFEGDRNRVRKTTFGDCVAKVEALVDLAVDDSYASSFRGVRDLNGRLQAGAIISRQIGLIFPYTEERIYLSIDPFTTPPWNCLALEGVELPEKIKGAARWLMSEIIQETIDTEIEGITKVLAIDRAKAFYLNIGFQENPEYPRELILTKEAALSFIQDQLYRRGERL